MSSTPPAAIPEDRRPLPVPPSLVAREILSAAWPLFKACLPLCLPLAVIGVAAGATPSAEAALNRAAHGAATYGAEWWGVAVASTVLMLICYGAVLRLQLALAAGGRLPVLDAIRRAAMDVPLVLPLVVMLMLPLLPAMLVTAWRGFGAPAALLTLAAGAAIIYGWFAWPALATRDAGADGRSPFSVLATSFRLVRGRWRAIALIAGTLLAAILVFVLLIGIFLGVVMGLAGQSDPTAEGLAFSRWLMALVLAVPVVYGGAVTVIAWRAAAHSAP